MEPDNGDVEFAHAARPWPDLLGLRGSRSCVPRTVWKVMNLIYHESAAKFDLIRGV